ncbi:MAG: hypothetical protein ACP5NX_03085 [Candidatus Bilamarchaeaceae archaeon]
MAVPEILEGLKAKGIQSAVVRRDGFVLESALPMDENTAYVLSASANLVNALMHQVKDSEKEIEFGFSNGTYLLAVPVKEFLFCAVVRRKDDKPAVREAAKKSAEFL